MCGINGFIRTTNAFIAPGIAADKVVRDLVYFSRLRGVDAFGVFKQSYHSTAFDSIKDVGEPLALVNEKAFKDFMQSSDNNQFFVMHNRHATRGKKEDIEGAHPYDVSKTNGKGRIILVHNGTISTNSLNKEYPGVTDSHSIAKMIADGMPLSEVENALWGAWALVWLDTQDNSLHFWRNKERPFGFVYSDKSIWFGSELYMVGSAMDRQDVKVESFERFPPMEEWIWHRDSKEFEKKKVTVKAKKSSTRTYSPPNGWVGENGNISEDDLAHFTAADSSKGGSKSVSSNQTKVVPFIESPLGPKFSPLRPEHIGSVANGHRRERNWKEKEPKFRKVKGISGWGMGDKVTFSLLDFALTKRNTQVKLEGSPVLFYNTDNYTRATDITVQAMTGISIDELDTKNCLYRGIITEMFSTEKVPYIHKISLRDVEPTDIPDRYRFGEKKPTVPLVPLEPQSLSPSVVSKITKSILREKKKDSTAFGSILKPCFSCGEFEKRAGEWHRVQESSVEQDYRGKEFHLCRVCFTSTICDYTVLERLFTMARMEKLNAEVTGHPKPFVHEASQIVQ